MSTERIDEQMSTDKRMTADEAAGLINDGDTVALVGGGGGMMEAGELHAAVERRFLASGHPSRLTLSHALGIGDREERGVNRFAHEGLVRRVIGGHWTWSPRMQELAASNRIEAYSLPGGVSMQLMREIGAGRPGLITRVGLGTFADPRVEGCKMNAAATDDLVETMTIDGETWLRYKPFPVHVALLRGSRADSLGNVTLEHEAAEVDTFAVALAAHNSGGTVIVQVAEYVEAGALPAHAVVLPAPLVDAIVVVPDQPTSYAVAHDDSLTGERTDKALFTAATGLSGPPTNARDAIAARAATEIVEGAVVNFGFGVPDAVAARLHSRGLRSTFHQTIEHGTYGGELLTGTLFGFARNPSAMIDGPSQFDFYTGGGLDIAFLGFGEVDRHGNVNASKLGGVTVGPGGFVDISQSARTMVFCGTFDAKGSEIDIDSEGVHIRRHGSVAKFVDQVAQITFSGAQAVATDQRVLYVTERAVFGLSADGLELLEVAPGVDMHADILDRISFPVRVAVDLVVTPLSLYGEP